MNNNVYILDDRAILYISGPDAKDFLQNIKLQTFNYENKKNRKNNVSNKFSKNLEKKINEIKSSKIKNSLSKLLNEINND